MRRREALLAIGFVLMPLATGTIASAWQRAPAQGSNPHVASFSEKVQSMVPEFEAVGRPMADVAVQIAYKYKLPMAIEHVDLDALRKPLRLTLKGQSVRQVIAAIVASVPGYQVDFSRGLVDIYSPAARRDPSNLLNMQIPRFEVDGLDTHLADAQLLCDIGRQLHGHSGCGGSVAGGQWGKRKITLHLDNRRVYEILNAIVAQNGEALWVPIAQPKEGSPLITGNFWYIYPLDPPFERSAVERLRELPLSQQRAP